MEVWKYVMTPVVAICPGLILGWLSYKCSNLLKEKCVRDVEAIEGDATVLYAGFNTYSGLNLRFAGMGFTIGFLCALGMVLSTPEDKLFLQDYLAIICVCLFVLLLFFLCFIINPMLVFTSHSVYVFPLYGIWSNPSRYHLDTLRWKKERMPHGRLRLYERVHLYKDGDSVCDTEDMDEAVDDFLCERVKPVEGNANSFWWS